MQVLTDLVNLSLTSVISPFWAKCSFTRSSDICLGKFFTMIREDLLAGAISKFVPKANS
jgi:hypothetical protein